MKPRPSSCGHSAKAPAPSRGKWHRPKSGSPSSLRSVPLYPQAKSFKPTASKQARTVLTGRHQVLSAVANYCCCCCCSCCCCCCCYCCCSCCGCCCGCCCCFAATSSQTAMQLLLLQLPALCRRRYFCSMCSSVYAYASTWKTHGTLSGDKTIPVMRWRIADFRNGHVSKGLASPGQASH